LKAGCIGELSKEKKWIEMAGRLFIQSFFFTFLAVDSAFLAPFFPSSTPSFPTFSATEAVFCSFFSLFFDFLQNPHIDYDSSKAFVVFLVFGLLQNHASKYGNLNASTVPLINPMFHFPF
jgi:hypothetical protein